MPTKWTPAFGAQIAENGVRFSVWAPNATTMDLELYEDGNPRTVSMDRTEDGVFSAFVAEAGAGTRYAFRLDGGNPTPDPYSRYQPDGRAWPVDGRGPVDLRVAGRRLDRRAGGRHGGLRAPCRHDDAGGDVPVPDRPVAGAEGAWRDGDRADAGRAVPGTLELGVRRCRPLRAVERLWHAGRPAGAGGCGACPGARRHPRRRLQPSRAGGQLPRALRVAVLQRDAPHRVGRRAELGWTGQPLRAAVRDRQRGVVDLRVPHRRPAPGRDARDHRRQREAPRAGADRAGA